MGRLIVLVLYTFLSMYASSSSPSSKNSSESLNGGSTSKRDILPHTIHFATGGAAHGEGGYGGGGRSPEIGQGGEGGSGSSTPKVPSSAAVIPVITGGGAINNHHVGHRSDASCISVCSRLQAPDSSYGHASLMLHISKQDLNPDMSSSSDEYFISIIF